MKRTGKNGKVMVPYSAIQGCFYMNGSAVNGFASVYLLDNGVSNTKIGLIYGIAGLISALLQMKIAEYADRPESVSVKQLLIYANLAALCFDLLLIGSFHRWALGNGFFYGCVVCMILLQIPFLNELGIESANQGKNLNFGRARGVGSVAYAIMSYVLGILSAKSVISIPLGMVVCNLGTLLFLFLMPFEKRAEKKREVSDDQRGGIVFLRHYPRYAVVLAGALLLYVSFVFMNNYTYQIVQSKGGNSAEMGVAMALSAFAEIPMMFGFAILLKKMPSGNWLGISGIFIFLKALLYRLCTNVSGFYAIQLLQMFGYAMLTVSSVYYINECMDRKDAVKGQAFFTMTFTLANVLAPLLAGRLIDRYGVETMLTMAVLFGFFGAMTALGGIKSGQRNGSCSKNFVKHNL